MIEPPRWSSTQLEADRSRAVELFRDERLQEPLEMYLELFDEYQGHVEDLLDSTVNLTDLEGPALDILGDPDQSWVLRFLTGPYTSADDLKTLALTGTLAASRLRSQPETVSRILGVVRAGLDSRRFPWIGEQRPPTETEHRAAVVATAALIATSRTRANRRNLGKSSQEDAVQARLEEAGLVKVRRRKIETLANAPQAGEFCGESLLGNRKADVIVRLWDHRILAVECKVSNSAVNSIKRVKNDAAAKAEVWLKDFGTRQIVPAAILSGVYDLHILEDAQSRGLTLFWAHDLERMVEWIEHTH